MPFFFDRDEEVVWFSVSNNVVTYGRPDPTYPEWLAARLAEVRRENATPEPGSFVEHTSAPRLTRWWWPSRR